MTKSPRSKRTAKRPTTPPGDGVRKPEDNGTSKRAAEQPLSRRPRVARFAARAAIATPTPQIASPASGGAFSAGASVTVHVTTNQPGLQSTVWLMAPDGSVAAQVTVTWPTNAPFEADVVITLPSPAAAFYTIELEQVTDTSTDLGGSFVHAIQINVQ